MGEIENIIVEPDLFYSFGEQVEDNLSLLLSRLSPPLKDGETVRIALDKGFVICEYHDKNKNINGKLFTPTEYWWVREPKALRGVVSIYMQGEDIVDGMLVYSSEKTLGVDTGTGYKYVDATFGL